MPKCRSKSAAKLNPSLSMLRQRQKLNRCRRRQKPTKSTEKLRWSKCSSKHCQRWPLKSQLHCLRLVLNTFLSSSSSEERGGVQVGFRWDSLPHAGEPELGAPRHASALMMIMTFLFSVALKLTNPFNYRQRRSQWSLQATAKSVQPNWPAKSCRSLLAFQNWLSRWPTSISRG